MQSELSRPIVGIENRTAQEVFDIMCDRFRAELGNEEAPRYTTRRLHEEIRKAEERGRQHEREAALSAAEPVCCGKPVHEGSPEAYTLECCGKFVQPAPSVAVKAIEAVWKYSLVIESSVRRGDGPEQYAGVTEALRLVKEARSALSAQVQDVAGWQPIETAPKDGSDVLLSSPNWHGDVVVGCWSFEGWRDREDSDKLEPTHWMPLPAAPAKQEGGHD